jgi:hypothetical protein
MKYKSVKLSKMPRSLFRCSRCEVEWTVGQPDAGQHRCPRCGIETLYFVWVNFAAVIAWLMKNDVEYRRSYGAT